MPRDLEKGPIGGGAKLRRRPSDLDTALDQLEAIADEAMPDAWMDRFGTAPPSALPPRLLRLAIAYDLQAAALGGLGKTLERRLLRIAEGDAPSRSAQPAPVRLKPGATLLRDWGGRTYRVEALADGNFSFEGRTWRSLSAIARKITETSRNGPAFFGLREGRAHGSK